MVKNDMDQAKKKVILKKEGFKLMDSSDINSVFIAGHKGMVGSAIKETLKKIIPQ